MKRLVYMLVLCIGFTACTKAMDIQPTFKHEKQTELSVAVDQQAPEAPVVIDLVKRPSLPVDVVPIIPNDPVNSIRGIPGGPITIVGTIPSLEEIRKVKEGPFTPRPHLLR